VVGEGEGEGASAVGTTREALAGLCVSIRPIWPFWKPLRSAVSIDARLLTEVRRELLRLKRMAHL
jgi:hypothetical protein